MNTKIVGYFILMREFISTYRNVASNISKYIIDILCVATHYSNRYGSADAYLKSCGDSKIANRVLYLTNKTSEQIVNTFIDECVENVERVSR